MSCRALLKHSKLRLEYCIIHQSFVTTAPPTTRNSGDNDFSSITALLNALHCRDLLTVIALLFITVNSTGVKLHNITSPALTWHCRGTQEATAPHINPAIPCLIYCCINGETGKNTFLCRWRYRTFCSAGIINCYHWPLSMHGYWPLSMHRYKGVTSVIFSREKCRYLFTLQKPLHDFISYCTI